MKINHHDIKITHKDKLIFPKAQITKQALANYYKKIASYILPFMENYPITMHRYPNGIEEDGFYMKNTPDYFPDWIETFNVTKKEGGTVNHVLCNSKETLIYLANQACITPHIWLSSVKKLDNPTKMIFDLDPSSKQYHVVKKAALALYNKLGKYNISSYVMTTGSSGLHVVVPLHDKYTFETVKEVATYIAKQVVDEDSDLFTLEQRKNKRENKVFIDTLRNAYGQTSVTPYGLRAINGAPVATPLSWKELKNKKLDPQKYTMNNIFRRLGQIDDPWEKYFHQHNSLDEILKEKDE